MRKIPVLTFNVQQEFAEESFDLLINNPEMREYVYKETINSISESILKKEQTATLFEIANSGFYVKLDINKWSDSLNKALKHFESKEDYDSCIKCRDLNKQIQLYERKRKRRTKRQQHSIR